MPTVQADRLRRIAEVLFEKAGASAAEAATVSRHCVNSWLQKRTAIPAQALPAIAAVFNVAIADLMAR